MNEERAQSPPHRARRWLRFSLAGLLFFMFCWAGLWAGVRFGAQRLTLSPDPLQLTVVQRSAQAIPGLQGLAHVQLDDITRGQVILTIHDDAKRPILGPVSAKRGDVLAFDVKGQPFFLHLLRLDNQLIGDDRAVIEISTTDRWSTSSQSNNRKSKSTARGRRKNKTPLLFYFFAAASNAANA
ncbi:MAG TPA: hypothetical protein VGK58_20555 [Lacipirellulaceae bacterium]